MRFLHKLVFIKIALPFNDQEITKGIFIFISFFFARQLKFMFFLNRKEYKIGLLPNSHRSTIDRLVCQHPNNLNALFHPAWIHEVHESYLSSRVAEGFFFTYLPQFTLTRLH